MAYLDDERMQILKMIEEGKITASEGMELLNAINADGKSSTEGDAGSGKGPKWLRIRVLSDDGRTKVNVNLPIALLDVALKMGSRFSPELKDAGLENLDFEAIGEAIKSGVEGKIVDVYNEEDNTTVEVYVE